MSTLSTRKTIVACITSSLLVMTALVGIAPIAKAAVSSPFTDVAAGGAHSCAVREDGTISCWGRNNAG